MFYEGRRSHIVCSFPQFQPQLVLVAAGYDALQGDPKVKQVLWGILSFKGEYSELHVPVGRDGCHSSRICPPDPFAHGSGRRQVDSVPGSK